MIGSNRIDVDGISAAANSEPVMRAGEWAQISRAARFVGCRITRLGAPLGTAPFGSAMATRRVHQRRKNQLKILAFRCSEEATRASKAGAPRRQRVVETRKTAHIPAWSGFQRANGVPFMNRLKTLCLCVSHSALGRERNGGTRKLCTERNSSNSTAQRVTEIQKPDRRSPRYCWRLRQTLKPVMAALSKPPHTDIKA